MISVSESQNLKNVTFPQAKQSGTGQCWACWAKI